MTPEIRELLGALADHDAADLLRIRGRDALREARSASGRVSPRATSLVSAERRLLEVHREELGRILYKYAVLLDQEDPATREYKLYADGAPLPDERALESRAKALLEAGLDEHTEGLLRRCIAGPGRPGSLEVLAAAARVAPSASIRIVQGANLLMLADDCEGAERVLRSVVADFPTDSVRSYAWETLGLLEAHLGHFDAARRNYRAALESDPTRKLPTLNWLRFAFVSGQKEETLQAAELVNHALQPGDPVVRWYRKRAEFGFMPGKDEGGVRTAEAIDDRLTGLARVMLHGRE